MTEDNEEGGKGLLSPHHHFTINYEIKEGPKRGMMRQGRFEFSVPAAGKQIEIARVKAMYLPAGGYADPPGALLVEMISYLSCTLTKFPPWWKPTTFWDTGVIAAVYEEATAYADKFLGKKPLVRRDADVVQDEVQDDPPIGPDDKSDVDGDVPPSRKRREVLTAHD